MNIIAEIRAAGNEAREEMELDAETAYAIAECMLIDPKFLAAAKKQWPGKSEEILKEIVADHL
jgi:hypothetical protein